MIQDKFAYISNYICQESMKNVNENLSDSDQKSFCYNDYYYLVTIYNMGRPNFSQLASELGLTKPAISVIIRKLSKIGLIEKMQSEKDKRVFYLSITEKGRKIVQGDEALYQRISLLIKKHTKDEEHYEFLETLLSQIVQELKTTKL